MKDSKFMVLKLGFFLLNGIGSIGLAIVGAKEQKALIKNLVKESFEKIK